MVGAADALDRVDEVAQAAVAGLLALSGVRRVGLALSEGGGRRLRFTASDRDNSRSVDWCHIDAYDDVPLTAVLRTDEPVVGSLDDLDGPYAGFVSRQRRQGTAAVAVVPLSGSASPVGAFILYYDTAQRFDTAQRSELTGAAAQLASELRAAQAVTARDVPALSEEPVPPGGLAADRTAPADPSAVGDVRRWTRSTLDEWALEDDLVDDAVLALSELVTNAVIHTGAVCEVRLLLDRGVLTATVRDQGSRRGVPVDDTPPTDPLRVHGRGLQVVGAVSSRWGSALDAGGTTVWFAIETSPPAAEPLEGSSRVVAG